MVLKVLLKNTRSNIHRVRCADRDIEMLVDRGRNVCTHTQMHVQNYVHMQRERRYTVMWIYVQGLTHTQTDAQSERSTQKEKHTHDRYARGESDMHFGGRERGERHAQEDRHLQTREERHMFIHRYVHACAHTRTHTHKERHMQYTTAVSVVYFSKNC